MDRLIVRLGPQLYRVERPWGDVPRDGRMTDVETLRDGRIVALMRRDPLVDEPADAAIIFARDGSRLGAIGKDRIADAHMLAIDSDDRIWIVDRDAHEIVAFDANGREHMTLGRRHAPGEPFSHPSGLAFSPAGDIAVGDGYGGGHVHLFDARGAKRQTWGGVGVEPGRFLTVHGVAWIDDDRIAVADRENHRVQVFDRSGRVLSIWTGFFRPSDLCRSADGDIYVSDGVPTVSRMSPEGERRGRCRPTLNGAHGLAVDRDGAFYLAEGAPSRITRLTPIAA